MSITVELNKQNTLYPEQDKKGIITNASPIPAGKTKMLITNIKSDSNAFSIAINFLSKSRNNTDVVEMTSIVPENAVKYFSNGMGYAYLNNSENREISLKYNNEDYFDYYYITLNSNTVTNEHSISFAIDFI